MTTSEITPLLLPIWTRQRSLEITQFTCLQIHDVAKAAAQWQVDHRLLSDWADMIDHKSIQPAISKSKAVHVKIQSCGK